MPMSCHVAEMSSFSFQLSSRWTVLDIFGCLLISVWTHKCLSFVVWSQYIEKLICPGAANCHNFTCSSFLPLRLSEAPKGILSATFRNLEREIISRLERKSDNLFREAFQTLSATSFSARRKILISLPWIITEAGRNFITNAISMI